MYAFASWTPTLPNTTNRKIEVDAGRKSSDGQDPLDNLVGILVGGETAGMGVRCDSSLLALVKTTHSRKRDSSITRIESDGIPMIGSCKPSDRMPLSPTSPLEEWRTHPIQSRSVALIHPLWVPLSQYLREP
ncbi:hypothetical protein BGX31_010373 [Mortierella sp. GBA43]|nr:hypothetical protein BGX31_010373 [Mortierella sp. GBA43]